MALGLTSDTIVNCALNVHLSDVSLSEDGIFSFLLNMDTEKAAGAAGIPNMFIYRYAEGCSKFIFLIL